MSHTAIRLTATKTNDPLGMACKDVLADLDSKTRLIEWLLALVVAQEKRRTTGGVPRPYTAQGWRNTTAPVHVHPDYEGVL